MVAEWETDVLIIVHLRRGRTNLPRCRMSETAEHKMRAHLLPYLLNDGIADPYPFELQTFADCFKSG